MLEKEKVEHLKSGALPRRSYKVGGSALAGARLGLPLIIFVAVIVIAALLTPGFFTVANARAILTNSALIGIVAVSMTPIMLSGNFISLATQQSAMAGMVLFVALVGGGLNWVLAAVAVLVLLVMINLLQAWVIGLGLNPIITTLAAGAVIFGAVSLTTGSGIVRMGEFSVPWGDADPLGIPLEVYMFVIFTTVVGLVSAKTVVGRQVLLLGANRDTARVSGISQTLVTSFAFLVFAFGLAIVAILNGAAFGEATVNSFDGLTISAIAAMLVGGSAIQGGSGSPINSAFGAVFIAIAGNLMTLNALSTGQRLFVEGLIVILAVLSIQLIRNRRGFA